MKSFCIVALAFVAVCASDRAYKADEGVDINAILSDSNKIEALLDCLLDSSSLKCSTLDAALKKDMVPAIGSACAKCTPQQKHNIYEFFRIVKADFPTHFKTMQKNFDPEDKLFKALDEALAAYKD